MRQKRGRRSALALVLALSVALFSAAKAEEEAAWVDDEMESQMEKIEEESPDDGDFFMPETGWDEAGWEEEQTEAVETPEAIPEDDAEEEDAYESAEECDGEEAAEEYDEVECAAPRPVREAVAKNGSAYVVAQGPAALWRSPGVNDGWLYSIEASNSVLLATEYVETCDGDFVRAWLMTEEYEVLCGYISADDLAENALTEEMVEALSQQLWAWPVETEVGAKLMFVTEGEKPREEWYAEEDFSIENEQIEEWPEGLPDEENDGERPDEQPEEFTWIAQPGDYIAVTTDTRAYIAVDETIEEGYGYDGESCAGYFVSDAILCVEGVEQDSCGRIWYRASYRYGDALDNGKLLWTAVGTVYVLAHEAQRTDASALTVTDFAVRAAPIMLMSMGTTDMNGFTLRSCSASTPFVYAGQAGVYATSGHDNEYPQIASLPGHGTIFATPHYVNNCVVYCLEHTMPGPNQSDGDGGHHPTGPYTIADLETYEHTPGPSGYIFKPETMHAIAWVLRHTVPFMELARSDSNNRTWSRVAGQFAIREVICEMEGDFYVREYWIMDDFVRQAGQAPAVYLAYARWLAENGIAYGRTAGNITASNKSMRASGSGYVATVTLTTDADRMRVSRDVGTLTGNSGGSDWQYYYLYSGDTISVTSSSASLSLTVESLPSSEDEANFLIGIPEVEIQKILIPQDGDPVPMKSLLLAFDVPMGAISVTKKSASGMPLSGAVMELFNSAGAVVATQTTDSNGEASFANLQPGTYTVREKSAPQGYLLSDVSAPQVQVVAGSTATVAFTNEPITAKIRIVKTDSTSGNPLSGAVFSVTRLSGPASESAPDIGKVVATVTTNAQGVAETGPLPWGDYRIVETGVPAGYLDPHDTRTIQIR